MRTCGCLSLSCSRSSSPRVWALFRAPTRPPRSWVDGRDLLRVPLTQTGECNVFVRSWSPSTLRNHKIPTSTQRCRASRRCFLYSLEERFTFSPGTAPRVGRVGECVCAPFACFHEKRRRWSPPPRPARRACETPGRKITNKIANPPAANPRAGQSFVASSQPSTTLFRVVVLVVGTRPPVPGVVE